MMANSSPAPSSADQLLRHLLAPSGVSCDAFFKQYWHAQPLHVSSRTCHSGKGGGGGGGGGEKSTTEAASDCDGGGSEQRLAPLFCYADAEELWLNAPPEDVIYFGLHKRRVESSASEHPVAVGALSPTDMPTPDGPVTVPPALVADILSLAPRDDAAMNPFAAFANGFSVVVNRADRYSGAFRRLCAQLEKPLDSDAASDMKAASGTPEATADTPHLLLPAASPRAPSAAAPTTTAVFGGFPYVYCNVYLTPEGQQSVPRHSDDRDVLILQVHGSKAWTVYSTSRAAPPLPFKHEEVGKEPSRPVRDEDVTVLLQCTLNQGDVLYVPRGYVHEAAAVAGAVSMHLTLALQTSDWDLGGLLAKAAADIAADPALGALLRPCMTLCHGAGPADEVEGGLFPAAALEAAKAALFEAMDLPRATTVFWARMADMRRRRALVPIRPVPLPVSTFTRVRWCPAVALVLFQPWEVGARHQLAAEAAYGAGRQAGGGSSGTAATSPAALAMLEGAIAAVAQQQEAGRFSPFRPPTLVTHVLVLERRDPGPSTLRLRCSRRLGQAAAFLASRAPASATVGELAKLVGGDFRAVATAIVLMRLGAIMRDAQ